MPITQLPNRPPALRLRAVAILTALTLHAAAVLFLPFPVGRPREGVVALIVPTDPEDMPLPLVSPAASELAAAAPGEASPTAGSDRAAPGPSGETPPALAGTIPFLPDRGAAPETASPSAAATETRAATLPLVVLPGG